MTISDVLSQWNELHQKHRHKSPEYPRTHFDTKERGNTYASRNAILKQMGFADYTAYRQSSLWAGIKLRVWKEKGRCCDICQGKAQTIHHRRYDLATLAGQTLEWLVPICCRCHEQIEFTTSGFKRTHEQAEMVYSELKKAHHQ